MRSSRVQLAVVPHPFMPHKPSERGFLYRPSFWNQYNRLNAMGHNQRTTEENRLLRATRYPDHQLMGYFCLVVGFSITTYWVMTKPLQMAVNRDRTLLGAMNQHELWKRNREMTQIFEYHRQLIDQTREQYAERPIIYEPPEAGGFVWKDPKEASGARARFEQGPH